MTQALLITAGGHTAQCALPHAGVRRWAVLAARGACVRVGMTSGAHLGTCFLNPGSQRAELRRILRRALRAVVRAATAPERREGVPRSARVVVRVEWRPSSFMHSSLAWDHRVKRNILYRTVMLAQISAWISTMGGAHAQLGEDTEAHGSGSEAHVREAEVCAYKQFRVAQKLGDKGLAARCKLHLGLSALQRSE